MTKRKASPSPPRDSKRQRTATRAKLPGKMNKIAPPRPVTLNASLTSRGAPINNSWGTGGFDASDGVGELLITRKTSYPALLRRAISNFIDKGNHSLVLHALGAAIPLALSLSLATQDALPCGRNGIDSSLFTTSVDVQDEIVPPEQDLLASDAGEEEETEVKYQTRVKNGVRIEIKLKAPLVNSLQSAAQVNQRKSKRRHQ